jgi:alpha-methylacyl-CoA racemase
VGAYAELLRRLGLDDDPAFAQQWAKGEWPALKARLASLFATRPRDDWCRLLEGSEACVAPVLSMDEAPLHPHNRSRATFVEQDGVQQPAPAPRFSRTQAGVSGRAPQTGQDSEAILRELGLSGSAIATLLEAGVVHPAAVGL